MELRLAYLLVAVLFALLGYVLVGLLVVLLPDSETNASIESTIATYFATSWIIVIELALFLGVLSATSVVLFSVTP